MSDTTSSILTSIKTLHNALIKKQVSAAEITQIFLNQIKTHNPNLNILISTTEEKALEDAKRADQQIAKGTYTALTGIPIIHKDVFCTKNILTSAASKMLSNFTPPYNATLVTQLEISGSILLGKANMDEFAMGASNEHSYYGVCKNPWNKDYICGGSSGGSAAAIAAGFAMGASGSDTGGSIRQPAAYCGITGIKPTYGTISRYGMIAYASSLDQPGPMAKSAEDCAYLLNSMAYNDPNDSTNVQHPTQDFTKHLNDPIKSRTIAYCPQFSSLLTEVQQPIFQNWIQDFQQAGCSLIEIDMPNLTPLLSAYYIIGCAEAASNLARYDGIRYGYKHPDADKLDLDLKALYKLNRSEGFGIEVKRRIMLGNFVLSSGHYDHYYAKAQKARALITHIFQDIFTKADVLFLPTTPDAARPIITEKSHQMESNHNSDLFNVPVNLAGLPAISIPIGFTPDGLPMGGQIIGSKFSEATLLNFSHIYQTETDWHNIHAPIRKQIHDTI